MFSRLSHPKDEVASSILVRGYVIFVDYEIQKITLLHRGFSVYPKQVYLTLSN